jgi:glycosyltransferase involved in cell wall biosynthesis
MRIVQLTPGSGDQFYCENCLRDAALVRALRAEGAEVVLVPMYLPLSLDGREPLERTEVFFGGVNVYLQQKLGLFRRTPRWLDKLFDSDWLLRKVSKKAGMTSAGQLGEMTLSMLKGTHGRQVKEIDRLIEFLSSPENKPDVLILSNFLLAGLAGPIKERLGCKLACWLQDEDGFVDGLGEPWAGRVWEKMAKIVPLFDLFLPVSRYFADAMQKRLSIPPEKMQVCPPGIDLSKYEPAAGVPEVPTIGFLGRLCRANGPDLLGRCFQMLNRSAGLEQSRLLLCGGMTSADRELVHTLRKELHESGSAERTEFLSGFDLDARLPFLRRLTVLCSPSRQAPAYAMNVLEAMACGVPFVAPKAGVYPEWAELTGGGIVYEPHTAAQLQKTVEPLLRDPARAAELGAKGRRGAEDYFDIRRNAADLKERLKELAEL